MGGQCCTPAATPKVVPLNQNEQNLPTDRVPRNDEAPPVVVELPRPYQRNKSVHALRAALVKKPEGNLELRRARTKKEIPKKDIESVSVPNLSLLPETRAKLEHLMSTKSYSLSRLNFDT